MEEVAAKTDESSQAAEQATSAVSEGRDASQQAQSATESVVDQTATTVTAVEETEDELEATSEKITDAMTAFRETAVQINETARGKRLIGKVRHSCLRPATATVKKKRRVSVREGPLPQVVFEVSECGQHAFRLDGQHHDDDDAEEDRYQ